MQSTLLGVPRAPGGTGKEEFEVIKMTLKERMVEGVQVLRLVFDTTLNNTGEREGVCRYLQFRSDIIVLFVCTVLCLYPDERRGVQGNTSMRLRELPRPNAGIFLYSLTGVKVRHYPFFLIVIHL